MSQLEKIPADSCLSGARVKFYYFPGRYESLQSNDYIYMPSIEIPEYGRCQKYGLRSMIQSLGKKVIFARLPKPYSFYLIMFSHERALVGFDPADFSL
jgi:hypothetical protein